MYFVKVKITFPCLENIFDSPTQAIQFKKIADVNFWVGKAGKKNSVAQQKQNVFTGVMPPVFFFGFLPSTVGYFLRDLGGQESDLDGRVFPD